MIEPLGYFDIFLQSLEVISLVSLLLLFFLERGTFGRSSIGHDSWPTVILYDVLTGGAYAIYWRLKVTCTLYSRDRFSSWQWAFILLAVFAIYETAGKILVLLLIWDFVIGNRLTKITKQQFSWVWTFIFGHLYLVSFVEREANLLPIDFRAPRPERRDRFVKIYSVAILGILAVIALAYWNLVEQRKQRFAQIPAETVDRSGHWYETDEKYETIYSEGKDGRRDIHSLIMSPHYKNMKEWARYSMDTKFHDGHLYTYSWFSCIQKYQVVEMNSALFVSKNAFDKTLIENRIETETFDEKRKLFLANSVVTRGWEWGELLKSPWKCEWGGIRKNWDQG